MKIIINPGEHGLLYGDSISDQTLIIRTSDSPSVKNIKYYFERNPCTKKIIYVDLSLQIEYSRGDYFPDECDFHDYIE